MKLRRLLALLLASLMVCSLSGCAKLREIREEMIARQEENDRDDAADQTTPAPTATEALPQTSDGTELTPPPEYREPEDVAAYLPILREHINPDDTYGNTPGTALLYDLNDDGTLELIMTYLDDGPNTSGLRIIVRYAVYSLRNGSVIQMLAPTELYALVGGCSGANAVVRKGGALCLLAHASSPEVDEDSTYDDGSYQIYVMHGDALQLQEDLQYRMKVYHTGVVSESESTFTLNGTPISYSDYLAFTGDIQYLAASAGTTYSDFEGCASTPIPDLIRQIESGEYN